MKGEQLAAGGTSEVFAWGDGRVLKLFHPTYAYAVSMEAERARIVHAAGLAVPAVFEEVEVEGRRGIVFERVDGPLLFARLRGGAGEAPGVGRLLAELHANVHSVSSPPGLRPVRQAVEAGLERLSHAERAQQRARLLLVPDGDVTGHGDMHPGNVIMSERGPVVIDWVNAFLVHPALDVARSCVLMRYGSGLRPRHSREASSREREIRHALVDAYLERYLAIGDVTREQVQACQPLCAGGVARAVPDHPEREALEALAEVPS